MDQAKPGWDLYDPDRGLLKKQKKHHKHSMFVVFFLNSSLRYKLSWEFLLIQINQLSQLVYF